MINGNVEGLNPFCMISLSELIANHASKLLVGNGYIFSSTYPEYKEAIEKIKRWNNLDSLFYQDTHIKSYYGYSLVSIDRTKGGQVYLTFAQPYATSRVAKIFCNEELASIWSRVYYGDTNIYVKTTYTKNTIERQFTSDDISLDGMTEKISEDLQLPIKEVHNLGIIPVKFMQNLPKKNFFGGFIGEFYPDMTPVRHMQGLIDRTWEMVWKELDYNRTRVFLETTNDEINKLENAGDIKKYIGDFIMQTKFRVISDGSGPLPIQVIQGDPKLMVYAEFIQYCIDKAFEGAGYSPVNDTTSQKTEAEVLITNSRDMETTRIKRTLYQSDWNDIFKKMFIMMGLDGDESKWVFEIKENTIVDRLKSLEESVTRIQTGLSTPKRELMKLDGVDESEAEEILKEITNDESKRMMEISKYGNIEQEL